MSSYYDKRRAGSTSGKIIEKHISYQQQRDGKRSSIHDVERVSLVGSVLSDQTNSSLEKRLIKAQDRIRQLEVITQQQKDMIERLMSTIIKMQEKQT